MSDKSMKELRKQLRTIVSEILTEEFVKAQRDAIKAEVNKDVQRIESDVKKVMHEMNERHKDTMGYLVRSVTSPKS